MTPVLAFDLETVPDVAGLRRLGQISDDLSDAQGVEAFQAERLEKGQSDFLPHYLQRIWVIGCAFRDASGFQVRCLGDGTGTTDEEESHRLRQFFGIVDKHSPQLVSWNGSGFDAPVLHHRALFRGGVGHRYFDTGDDDRDFKYNNYLSRYHTRHLDLMDVLSNFTGRANAPLDRVSQLCGLPGKLGEDGAKVWQACLEGRYEQVAAYCETDVVNTYLLYQRFRVMRGEITEGERRTEDALVRAALTELIGDPSRPLQGAHWTRFLEAWSAY